jgi:hypothetical protein
MGTRAAGLVLLTALAWAWPAGAAPEVERSLAELPPALAPDAVLVVVSEQPGAVRWGIDGWQLPPAALRPPGSVAVGNSVESPLEGPARDGRYRLRLGPFGAAASSLQVVLHNADGSWSHAPSGADGDVKIEAGALTRRRPITLGPGPWLGRSGTVDLFEQLQDWEYLDCRGVDPADDARSLGDGRDAARDLLAVYSRREGDHLYLRADLLELGLGDEHGALDLTVLIDAAPGGQTWLPDFVRGKAGAGWELALTLRHDQEAVLRDASWSAVTGFAGAHWRGDLDAVELGVRLDALRAAGWDGQRGLRFAVYTTRDGHPTVADAFAEASLDDGVVDAFVAEGRLGGTAKYSVILHGNQMVQPNSWIQDLVLSQGTLTPAGNPTGYLRALDAHELFRAPVNIHVSGTLAAAAEWAAPELNHRIRAFLDGRPETGSGALLGGVLAEHIAPYFENARSSHGSGLAGEGVNGSSVRLNDELLDRIYGGPPRRVFWIPERVVRGATFADVLADGAGNPTGYTHTVIDQFTHMTDWFGHGDAHGANGYKLNRINGVECFAINDGADQWKFANTDGGLWLWTRRELAGKALSPDQEQLTLVFDDWEAFSGRSFTSFGVGNDNPDNYERTLRWLANHPWIQVVTLEQVASWGWASVDRGHRPNLSLRTYDWLEHATERSYHNWYYGSSQEEPFWALRPERTPGQPGPKAFGEIDGPGGLLHDVWAAVATAPAGRLRDLAAAIYSTDVYETAWHDEDQNDYLSKTPSGDYAFPDTTYDKVSGWAISLHARVGDAALVAAVARWSAAPPASPRAWRADVDHDGEDELLLADARACYVFENDGARLVFAAVRDPASGEAEPFAGTLLNGPGDLALRDRIEADDQRLKRPPGLTPWWADGAGADYVNAVFSMRQLSDGWELTAPDGRLTVRHTLANGELTTTYTADASLGTVYLRAGLAPAALDLFMGAPLADRATAGGVEASATTRAGRTVRVLARPLGGAWSNPGASFGGRGPRGIPLCHQVELAGRGTFAVRLEPSLR